VVGAENFSMHPHNTNICLREIDNADVKVMQVAQVTNERCFTGLGAEEARKLCPPDFEVACHNGPNFCILSGPAESMTKFVKTLQEQGVFAEEVNCGNIAYHSKYISSAGPLLRRYLQKVKIL
jgi:fatty acid synthase